MKNIFVLLLSFSFSAYAIAADWQFLFNHQLQNAEGHSMKRLNGSYYFIGNADDSLGNTKTVLTKLDQSGNILWWKNYPDSIIRTASFINITDASELIVTGQKISSPNSDCAIMLLDTFGSVIWNRSFSTAAKNESLKYIESTFDKGFIGCGFITQANLAANDFLVIKFDSTGNVVWQKEYGSRENDYAQTLRHTGSGNYIISGDSYNGHDYDNYLLLIDSAGNEIWHRQIGDINDNGNQTLLVNHEGNFILCGESTTTANFDFDIYLAAVDTAGNLLWSKYVGGNGSDAGFAITENTAHQYFITGYSSSAFSGAPYTAYLLQLDSTLHPICLKYFLQPDLTICYDEIMLNDSNFALAGTSGSSFYFALVNHFGCTTNFIEHNFVSGFNNVLVDQLNAKVFLTSNSQLKVEVISGEYQEKKFFKLFSVDGKTLTEQYFSESLSIDLSPFENHFFVWQITSEDGKNNTGKLVKQYHGL